MTYLLNRTAEEFVDWLFGVLKGFNEDLTFDEAMEQARVTVTSNFKGTVTGFEAEFDDADDCTITLDSESAIARKGGEYGFHSVPFDLGLCVRKWVEARFYEGMRRKLENDKE